ncbi:CsbD-like domain-containing protein [Pleurotus pulmonarius]
MPLFGKSRNDATTHGRHHDQVAHTGGATGFAGPGHIATGTGPGTAATGYVSAPGAGVGAGPISSGMYDTAYNNTNTLDHHHHGGVGTGQGVNDPYSSGQATGAGYGSSNIPPANALSHGHNERHQDGAGSSALKAKGLQKEQEANSIKLQSQELAEAERLEAEARTRRERAVAHGASPEHQNLGGSTRY